ncbi:MAG: hypothetical protein GY805_32760 [Chloroflexi bacterium]|nr:hypothetical protein [Chloroflexota bacterium]
MAEENVVEPINILLSREELLLLLNMLQADSIPGLDVDPAGVLNDEQRALAYLWGGRSLRARELAQVGDNDSLKVHNALLTAVAACAYSNNALFIYHWSKDDVTPTRYFGHIRGDDIATHRRPEDVLHLFTLLPSKKHLFDQVMDVCEYEDLTAAPLDEIRTTEDDFVRVRKFVSQRDAQVASGLLINRGASAETAEAFVNTLGNSPRISVFQTFKQEGETAVKKGDFTVLQDNQHAWFIAPTPEEDNGGLFIKPTTRNEIEGALADLL